MKGKCLYRETERESGVWVASRVKLKNGMKWEYMSGG